METRSTQEVRRLVGIFGLEFGAMVILWMALGACLFGYGGMLLVGLSVAVTNKDAARVMDIEMTKGLLVFVVIIAILFVYGGFAMFASNLLVAASVLQ